MKLQSLNLSQISTYNTSLPQQRNKAISNVPTKNKIGAFPSYYCPNINFGSRFGEIDFSFDFYNCGSNIINYHLDKMELTKNLNKAEQEDFRKNLFSSDKPNLLQFFNDKKPSVLLSSDFPYFQNNDKYNFVRRTINSKIKDNKIVQHQNTFILNKELTKQTIEENKELYTKRMGLKKDASVEDIYEKLVGEDSPLKQQNGYDDIVGITLGFSPINCVLFQLERNIPNRIDSRKNRYVHSEILKRELYSSDCVYSNFSDKFFSKVENALDDLKRYRGRHIDLGDVGYMCIQFVPDEQHTQKVIRNSEEILEKNKKYL